MTTTVGITYSARLTLIPITSNGDNKYLELKERLINPSNGTWRAMGPVMEPQVDEEAAAICTRAYSALMNAHDTIRK